MGVGIALGEDERFVQGRCQQESRDRCLAESKDRYTEVENEMVTYHGQDLTWKRMARAEVLGF